ncbi:hypothetical protein BCR34DRAFT_491145, partial [Clohesyomyces aquaticus]
LSALLDYEWIRRDWYSSEIDEKHFGIQEFISLTLVANDCVGKGVELGRVWRVKVPMRLGRDALCCDLIINTYTEGSNPIRIRLINVHLNPLPISHNLRPRQLAITSSYLRAADCGLIAGDFSPVFPEDNSLIADNGLEDAWLHFYPGKRGWTWGVKGNKSFPPGRFDMFAQWGLGRRG